MGLIRRTKQPTRTGSLTLKCRLGGRHERVETLDIDYPDDEVLRMQLTSVKFDITRTGKLICEPKDATKKRIGCSPDRADAWIMGIWVLPFVEPLSSQDIAENRDYKSLGGVIIPRFGRAI